MDTKFAGYQEKVFLRFGMSYVHFLFKTSHFDSFCLFIENLKFWKHKKSSPSNAGRCFSFLDSR